MNLTKQKIKKKVVNTVETLSNEVRGQITGKERAGSVTPENRTENYTALSGSVLDTIREQFQKQEEPELDEVRRKLAEHSDENPQVAIKRQFEYMRREEKNAIESRKQEEMERKQKEEEAILQKAREEEQARQANATQAEPQGKAQRGGLFARKKKHKQTVENKPSFGKQ